MINFLLNKRYTIMDLTGQNISLWLVVKYDNYWYFLAIIPFAFVTGFLESIRRVNNGGKK
jgi:hypothetical protein